MWHRTYQAQDSEPEKVDSTKVSAAENPSHPIPHLPSLHTAPCTATQRRPSPNTLR